MDDLWGFYFQGLMNILAVALRRNLWVLMQMEK